MRYFRYGLLLSCYVFVVNSELQMHTSKVTSYLNTLFSYNYAEILRFVIPADTETAVFELVIMEPEDDHLNLCYRENISIYLKYNSIPVIKIHDIPLPPDFVNGTAHILHVFQMDSNVRKLRIPMPYPHTGSYYMLLGFPLDDPGNVPITQSGMTLQCATTLKVTLFTESIAATVIADDMTLVATVKPSLYKIFIPANIVYLDFRIRQPSNVTTSLYIRCEGVPHPNAEHTILHSTDDDIEEDDVSLIITTSVSENHWYYILMNTSTSESIISAALFHVQSDDHIILHTLQRMDYSLQTFKYSFYYQSLETPLPLTCGFQTLLRFYLNPLQDTGGTLFLKLRLSYNMKDDSHSERTLVVCLNNAEPLYASRYHTCTRVGRKHRHSDMILNKTHTTSHFRIPFPEEGQWYLTLALFCSMNMTDYCSSYTDNKLVALNNNYTKCQSQVSLDLSSSACVSGKCAPNGHCFNGVLDGVLFSKCKCRNKFKGWTCEDGRFALPYRRVLAELILLVGSNVLFVAAAYVAYRRSYNVASIVYLSTALFSMFYHACDTGQSEIRYCLVQWEVLQFGDFYAGLLSVWMTFLCVADVGGAWHANSIRPQHYSSHYCRVEGVLQMVGAIVLAVATTIDKTSLWVISMPTFGGFCIVLLCWCFKCWRFKRFCARKSYCIRNIPLSAGIGAAAVVIYARLETVKNYMYMHSLWHMLVATCIMVILPPRNTFIFGANSQTR